MSTLANSASDAEREQTRMLRDSAVDFVARFSDLKRLRVLRHQLPGFDTQIQRGMVESGWFALLVPEALGGFGGRFTDMAVLAEELGKGLIAEALIAPAVLVTRTLVHQAHSEACRLLLTRVMAGETHIALAWQSAAGGLSATGATVIARATETGVTLAGSSAFVVGAGAATAFIVVAHENGAPGLYLVDALQSGVTLAHAWRVDGTPITHLTLQDVAVKAEQRLAQGAKVALALSLAIDETRVMVAAELLGVMRAALDLTLGYLRTRVQFKQAIGSFQALQHRAVDQYIQLRLSAASIEAALRVLDQPQDTNQTDEQIKQRTLAVSRAKARCSDAALKIAREAIQMHGAVGYTDEYDIGLYLKRAVVLSAWLGNGAQHRRRCAELYYPSQALCISEHGV